MSTTGVPARPGVLYRRIHAPQPLSQMSFGVEVGLKIVTVTSRSAGPSGITAPVTLRVGTTTAFAVKTRPASLPIGAAATVTVVDRVALPSRCDRTVMVATPAARAT